MRKNKQVRTYRSIFVNAYGLGPHTCHFCRKQCDLETVHHLNGDHSDDRLENLAASHDSCHKKYHKTGYLRPDNTSGHPGVSFRKGRGIWIARKVVDGKRIYVGSAKTAEEAAALLKETA